MRGARVIAAVLIGGLLAGGILLGGCATGTTATTPLTNGTTTPTVGSTTTTLTPPETPSSGHHPDTTATTDAPVTTVQTTDTTSPDWLGTTSSSTTPTTASSPPVFGNTVDWGGQEITVWAPGLWGGATVGLGKHKEIQTIEVRIVSNDLSGNIEYSFIHFEARDNESFTYDASLKLQSQQLLGSGMLAPGKAVDGYVGFEIPKGNTLASVTYTPITYGSKPLHFTWEK